MKHSKEFDTSVIGKFGEDEAAEYLRKLGYRIIFRNFTIKRIGEIDTIAEEISGIWPFSKKTIVFVEVKALSRDPCKAKQFDPELHVDAQKSRKLITLAQYYMSRNMPKFNGSWRIDVIAVEIDCFTGNILDIRHHKNAVHF